MIAEFCDKDGMLHCKSCGRSSGYIQKTFKLQEEGETWEPILRGVVRLGTDDDTYQPFVFLASYRGDQSKHPSATVVDWPITDLWFSYYKDLRGVVREDGTFGKLKMGYGPGGPPVINITQLLDLLKHLVRLKLTTQSAISTAIEGG